LLAFRASADLRSLNLKLVKIFYHEEHKAHEEKQKYNYNMLGIKIVFIISS